MSKEWRAVKGTSGYWVSSTGEVRGPSGRILAEIMNDSGHLGVNLVIFARTPGVRRMIHHLVLEAFVGPRPAGMVGCHNDGNPSNNDVSNLRWDTHQSNMADRDAHGRTRRGEAHARAVLTHKDVDDIRRRAAEGETQSALAREYGRHQAHISKIVRREIWNGETQ